ncbi:MAG: hypothetical protein LBR69_02065 [Endomicrobium sp.]|jgi:predicted outer membrane repeat protein|nr:hypothetical protein [Endomicrobium sp.]
MRRFVRMFFACFLSASMCVNASAVDVSNKSEFQSVWTSNNIVEINLLNDIKYNSAMNDRGARPAITIYGNNFTLDNDGIQKNVLNVTNANAEINIYDLVIKGGRYAGNGGGIRFVDSASANNSMRGNLTNVTFESNDAYGNYNLGGGVWASGMGSLLTFSGRTNFNNNSAASGGGLFLTYGASAVFGKSESDTTNFTGNEAFSNLGGLAGGGALAINSPVWYRPSTIEFNGTVNFTDNRVTSDNNVGGAISADNSVTGYGYQTTITFKNDANFTGNSAKAGGGAISNNYSSFTFIGNAKFDSNKVSSGSGYGGAIRNTSNANAITSKFRFGGDADFINNSAGGYGGAIASIIDKANARLSNEFFGTSSFTGNSAGSGGGAVYMANTANYGGTVSNSAVFNGRAFFTSNAVTAGNGGAVYISNANNSIGFADVTFRGNQTNGGSGLGGAVYMASGASFSAAESLFDGNSAAVNGGAVYVTGNNNSLLLTGRVTATGNVSGANGGFLYNDGSTLTIDANGTYGEEGNGNRAEAGGVFYVSGGSLNLAGDSVFSANAAASEGGAVYINGGSFVLSGTGETLFSGNTDATGANDVHLAGGSLSLASSGRYIFRSGISGAERTEVVHSGTGYFEADMSRFQGTYTQSEAGSSSLINGDVSNRYAIRNGNAVFSGSLSAAGRINNAGTAVFSGSGKSIIGELSGTGDMKVSGNIINAAKSGITQHSVEIFSGGKFTTDLGKLTLTGSLVNNAGIFEVTAGTNSFDITGNGEFLINGDITNKAGSSVSQNAVTVTASGSLTASAGDITASSGIRNDGAVTFTGGTNNNTVTGNNGNLYIAGEVTNNAVINQAVFINGYGSLRSDAADLRSNVRNDSRLALTGGAVSAEVSGRGTLNVTGAVSNSGYAISQNTLNITGSLTSDADSLSASSFTNRGTLTFTGGTNSNIITGDGGTVISSGVVNNGSISQNDLTINDGADFTTFVSSITIHNGVTNNGVARFTGNGVLRNAVKNSSSRRGHLDISGNINNSGNRTITQNVLDISETGRLTTAANLLHISGSINNAGVIDYTGGRNESAVSGTGKLTVSGRVVNETGAAITQNEIEITGSLAANASDLTAPEFFIDGGGSLTFTGGVNNNVINNAGILYFNTGTNNADINGTGTIEIGGTFINLAGNKITQNALNIDASGIFTVNSEDFYISGAINNAGILKFDGLNETNNNEISGKGILEINGTVVNPAGISIAQNTVKVAGKLSANASDITVSAFENTGTLTFTGGTNANTVTGTGNTAISGNVINSGNITQDNITVNNSASLISHVSALRTGNYLINDGNITFTGEGDLNNCVVNAASAYGKLIIDGAITNGGLKGIAQNDLEIKNGGSFSTGASLINIRNIITNSGTLFFSGGNNGNIIGGGGNTVIGGNVTNAGGRTITQDKIIINAESELRSRASDLHAVSGIENSGNLIFTDTSGTNGSVISGNGVLTVSGAVGNTAGKTISQSSLAVEGRFTANASDILNMPITNTGVLRFTGGTNVNSVSGTGILSITGITANSAPVSQRNVNISADGEFTTNAGLIGVSERIANAGKLIFSGGDNFNFISGTGGVDVTGSVINHALIRQNELNISGAGNFTSLTEKLNIGGAITNGGTFNLNGHGILSTPINGGYAGSGTLNIGGSLENAAGNVITQKNLNIAGGAVLTASGSDLRIGNSVNNAGVLNILENNFRAGNMSLSSDESVFNMQNHNEERAITAEFDTMDSVSGSAIKMGVYSDGSNDRIKVNNKANLDGSLFVKAGVGSYENAEYSLIEAGTLTGRLPDNISEAAAEARAMSGENSSITYNFLVENNTIKVIVNGFNTSSFFSLGGLSYNQESAAAMLDEVSGTSTGDLQNIINGIAGVSDLSQKELLSEITPYFIANIARAGINNRDRTGLYKRMGSYYDESFNFGLWADGSFGAETYGRDENSINDYVNASSAFAIGADKYFKKSGIIAGLYGSYTREDIRQGRSSSEGSVLTGGGYAGAVKEKAELKGMFSFGYGSYDNARSINSEDFLIDRKAKSDFNGLSASADIEAGYKINLSKAFLLKPFTGIEASMFSYGGFNETGAESLNANVKGGSNISSSFRAGLGFEARQHGINWGASFEYNFVMAGYENEIESKLEGGDWFKVKGSGLERHIFGANIGAGYFASENFNIYLNGAVKTAGGYNNYTGTLGVKYFFKGI